MFVSTHYMEEAEYCHRLALMNRGKLIALDTPALLRAAVRDPLFELHTSDSLHTVKLLQRTDEALEVAMYGRAVHVAVTDADRARSASRRC